MNFLHLLLIACFTCCGSGTDSAWEPIKVFKLEVTELENRVESFLSSIEEIMKQKFQKSTDFLKYLFDNPIIDEIIKLDELALCKNNFTGLELSSSFRHGLSRIETPLRLKIAEILQRFVDINEKVMSIENLVKLKIWECRSDPVNCTNQTEIWLKQRLTNLTCELQDCQAHPRTKRYVPECGLSQWQCRRSQECINEKNVCHTTGRCYCGDCSDQAPGCFSHCFNGFHCKNLNCIDKLFVCDGRNDCGDNSDELHCEFTFVKKNTTEVSKVPFYGCSKAQFRCENGECINKVNVCNGEYDCSDRSDEIQGCSKHCYENFHCANLKCMDTSSICNDIDDCGDGSDESFCPPKRPIEEKCNQQEGKFLCSNKRCIRLDQTCDGRNDCRDGSDEGGMCQSPFCSSDCYTVGGVCLPQPGKSLCMNRCPTGRFEVNKTCVPVLAASVPVSQLVAQLSDLLHQYQADVTLLSSELLLTVSRTESDYIKCKDRNYEFFNLSPYVLLLPTSTPAGNNIENNTYSPTVSSQTEENVDTYSTVSSQTEENLDTYDYP